MNEPSTKSYIYLAFLFCIDTDFASFPLNTFVIIHSNPRIGRADQAVNGCWAPLGMRKTTFCRSRHFCVTAGTIGMATWAGCKG